MLALGADRIGVVYGLQVEVPDAVVSELADDAGAAALNAVLCAVQASWAWRRRDEGFGIPGSADGDEGWIADPATLARELENAAT